MQTFNQVAIVTGASYGIGRATAIALAKEGYCLLLTDINKDTLLDTKSTIENLGKKVFIADLDICEDEQINQVIEYACQLGELYLLVNNAGQPSLRKPVVDIGLLEWENLLNVNLTGTFFMTKSFGKKLIEQVKGGCIVNIGSTHGHVGFKGASTYGITKAGIIHLSKVLSLEWAQYNIRVNTVSPGSTLTESRAESFSDPIRKEELLSRIPLHRFCSPDEVAAAIQYLASPLSSYITGQTILLDGGLTAA